MQAVEELCEEGEVVESGDEMHNIHIFEQPTPTLSNELTTSRLNGEYEEKLSTISKFQENLLAQQTDQIVRSSTGTIVPTAPMEGAISDLSSETDSSNSSLASLTKPAYHQIEHNSVAPPQKKTRRRQEHLVSGSSIDHKFLKSRHTGYQKREDVAGLAVPNTFPPFLFPSPPLHQQHHQRSMHVFPHFGNVVRPGTYSSGNGVISYLTDEKLMAYKRGSHTGNNSASSTTHIRFTSAPGVVPPPPPLGTLSSSLTGSTRSCRWSTRSGILREGHSSHRSTDYKKRQLFDRADIKAICAFLKCLLKVTCQFCNTDDIQSVWTEHIVKTLIKHKIPCDKAQKIKLTCLFVDEAHQKYQSGLIDGPNLNNDEQRQKWKIFQDVDAAKLLTGLTEGLTKTLNIDTLKFYDKLLQQTTNEKLQTHTKLQGKTIKQSNMTGYSDQAPVMAPPSDELRDLLGPEAYSVVIDNQQSVGGKVQKVNPKIHLLIDKLKVYNKKQRKLRRRMRAEKKLKSQN